jgi:hypothetical protein
MNFLYMLCLGVIFVVGMNIGKLLWDYFVSKCLDYLDRCYFRKAKARTIVTPHGHNNKQITFEVGVFTPDQADHVRLGSDHC